MEFDYIYISAGVRGLQVRMAPGDFVDFVGAVVTVLIQE